MESRIIWLHTERIRELWSSSSDSINSLKSFISSSSSVKDNNSFMRASRNHFLKSSEAFKDEIYQFGNGILKKLQLIPNGEQMWLKCLTYSSKKFEQDLFDTLMLRLSSLIKSGQFGFGDYHMGWIHRESENEENNLQIYYMKHHMIRGTLRDLIKVLHPSVMVAKKLKDLCDDKDSNISHKILYDVYGQDFVPQILKFEVLLIDDEEELFKGYNSLYLQFISELVGATDYLHLKCLVHNNMKPENVLVTEEYHLRLSDPALFANCVHDYFNKLDYAEDSGSEKTPKDKTWHPLKPLGCHGYQPPEYLPEFYVDTRFDQENIDPMTNIAGDWFSLGVIIYELLTGLNPILDAVFFKEFENFPKEELYAHIVLHPSNNNHYIFSQDAAQYLVNQQYLPLVKRLIHPDPAVRPDGKIIKSMAIFSGINFQTIVDKPTSHKVNRLLEELSTFLKNKKISQKLTTDDGKKLKREDVKTILEYCYAIRPPITPTNEFPTLRRRSGRSSKKLQWDDKVEFDPKKPLKHLSKITEMNTSDFLE